MLHKVLQNIDHKSGNFFKIIKIIFIILAEAKVNNFNTLQVGKLSIFEL